MKKTTYVYDKIPKILNVSEFNEPELKIISFLSSKTLILIKTRKEKQYIPFGRDLGAALAGNDYAKHIQNLLDKEIIDIETIGTDLDGQPIYYSSDGKKAKSYRFNKQIRENLKQGQYTKNVLKMPWVYVPKKTQDFKQPITEIEKKLFKNYQSIKMNENWQTMPDLDMMGYMNARTYYKQITTQSPNITTGTTGRLYHPSICMCREFRKYLTKDGNPLAVVDAKTFHPFLLAFFLEGDEREIYLDFLKSRDFYSNFVDDENTRDDIKILFEISLTNKKLFGTAKIIRDWYQEHFPNIAKHFNGVETMQAKLQKLESKIFIEAIFANAEFWCIPMHDGLMVQESDLQDAMIFCYQKILEVLEFNVVLESKVL